MPSSYELDQAVAKIEKTRALMSDTCNLTISSHEVVIDLLDEALAHLQTLKAFSPPHTPAKCPLFRQA